MIIFKSIQNDPAQPNYGEDQEVGRIWIQDGRISVRVAPSVVAIAGSRLTQTFGDPIDPATDPEMFIAALPERYHGTYFWAEEAPDETPAQV
jgi:hypothetical protein